MKIVRFVTPDNHVGIGRLTRPGAAQPLLGSLFDQPRFADTEVSIARLLPPIEPPNIFCIGRNYRAHAAETGSALPEKPMVFMKPTTALAAPDEPIVIPAAAPGEVDFEAELAIVIGRRARRVSEAEALDYVFGYTCANDVSARDCQRSDKQWARAKGFDTFCPLGPWVVTADELDPDACLVRSRLNGQVMQSASTSEMVHSCRALVSYLSQAFTLLPGTLILTGTPEGVGMARTPPVFLRPGDRIEVEIEGVGVLSNPVVSDAA
ncbi:MAG: fumarylacetoacetate hydrolase family protein [Phycisphaerales bacterium]|nr:fumarylacetoacetate hydrolase family protein [Phycisphaerales bacterium]